jgi:ubiquinone/menaquinone biosynthesis C-methylase UbiE
MYHHGLCAADDHPIEELPFKDDYFDLTVMINVLDHVQNAELCISNAIRITKPGGIIIIGNELSNESDLISMQNAEGEIGHPIKMDHTWLDHHIHDRLEPIVHKILPREAGRDPAHHYGVYVFSGKKALA